MYFCNTHIQKNNIVYKTHTTEEAHTASLKYFNGDNIAALTWMRHYALKDSDGNLCELSPADMHQRIATELARIESNYPNAITQDEIFDLIDKFRYLIPGARCMSGIGNKNNAESLSNCFAIGLEGASDSYGAIMHIDEEQVQIMKRRGGVGHDISQLRPKGYPIKASNRTSIGIIPFMERYANSTREIANSGSLMLSISVKHPEVRSFVDTRLSYYKFRGTNVSIKIDDDFMRAIINGRSYTLQFPTDAAEPAFSRDIDAQDLWQKIIHSIWQNAEPGLLFWDKISEDSITDCYADLGYESICTSPYGEIPLCAYDSCRMLSINLYSYVRNPYTNEAEFDMDLFKKHVRLAVRLLDDIVDLDIEKFNTILKKIEEDPESDEVKSTEKHLWEKILCKTRELRRIGLGVIGAMEMMGALNVSPTNNAGLTTLLNISKQMALAVYSASVELAKERGPFSIYNADKEKDNAFINRIKNADEQLYSDMVKYGRRNISCIAIVKSEMQKLSVLAEKPINAPKVEVDYMTYVKTLGKIQEWVDHSVSINVEMPSKTDEATISRIYIEAWRSGCKNCLVHREGTGISTEDISEDEQIFRQPLITETRPTQLECDVVRFQNNKEKWVAFVGLLDGYPYEIFTGLQDDDEGIALPKSVTRGKIIKTILPDGAKRYDFQFQNKKGYKTTVEGLSEKFNKEYWNYAKLISGVLRYRMPTENVIKLVGSLQLENESINTWKNGVKQALKKYCKDSDL